MKTHLFLAAILLGSLGAAHAAETQDEAVPTQISVSEIMEAEAEAAAKAAQEAQAEEPVPESIPIPTDGGEFAPGVIDEPLPLLPDMPYGGPGGGFGPAPGVVLRKERALELRQAIRIRELQTLVEEDPEVREQVEIAAKARTFEGERTARRNYYTLLAKKIIARDKSLKEPVEERLARQLRSLEQRHVRPSVLIEPIAPVPGSQAKAKPKREG